MSRYIDADALLDLWRERKKPNYHENLGAYYQYVVFGNLVNEQPTVDAVPVARCKDCKWAEVDAWWTYCKLGHKEDTTNSIIYTCTHDFYCADGERRSK